MLRYRVQLQGWKKVKLDKHEEFKLEKSEIRNFRSCSRKTTIKGFVVATCSWNQDNASKCSTLMWMMVAMGMRLMMWMIERGDERARMIKQCGHKAVHWENLPGKSLIINRCEPDH